MRRLVGALQVAWLALGVRVTLQGWRDRWESAQEGAMQRDVRRAECRARWLQGHPELAARAVQVKQMRGGMSEEERGEWLRSSRLLREWGWSSRWDGPGCGWGWEEAAGGGYSIMQAQAGARGRAPEQARYRYSIFQSAYYTRIRIKRINTVLIRQVLIDLGASCIIDRS